MTKKEEHKTFPFRASISFIKMIQMEALKRNISTTALIKQAIVHFLETYNQ